MEPCTHPPLPAELEPLHAAMLALVPWWRPIIFGGCGAMLAVLAAVMLRDLPASWRAEQERRQAEELRRLRAAAIERAIAEYHGRKKARPRRVSRERER